MIEVEATLRPDGILVPDERLPLPAGRVRLSVESVEPTGQVNAPRFWQMMQGIWSNLQASGFQPRTREEIDAEIRALRDEAEVLA